MARRPVCSRERLSPPRRYARTDRAAAKTFAHDVHRLLGRECGLARDRELVLTRQGGPRLELELGEHGLDGRRARLGETLGPHPDESHGQTSQVDPGEQGTRDEEDLAPDVRGRHEGAGPGQGTEVARADLDRDRAGDEPLLAQPRAALVRERAQALLYGTELVLIL